jgi:single-strand DNA-binding protein
MNKLVIIGNLTRDPETRTVSSGSTVCSFTIAVNRKVTRGNQPDADFFRVSAWNKLGDVCQRYLAKGRKCAVTGSVSVSSYEGKDGATRFSLDVFAEDVEFLSPKEQHDNGAFSDADDTANRYDETVPEDSDLPF